MINSLTGLITLRQAAGLLSRIKLQIPFCRCSGSPKGQARFSLVKQGDGSLFQTLIIIFTINPIKPTTA